MLDKILKEAELLMPINWNFQRNKKSTKFYARKSKFFGTAYAGAS